VSGITEWVRGLVILVMLASCLELILPMNSMKKFVRMSMGLLVVLAICRPVLGLLGRPIAIDMSMLTSPESSRLPTLAQIMHDAEVFRSKNQTLVEQEAAQALSEEARQAALSVPRVAEAKATVLLSQSGARATIKSVTVMIVPGRSPGEIRPVEPVQIPAAPAASYRPPNAGEVTLANAVRKSVASRLGLEGDTSVVAILMPGESEPSRR
jgi:stage III sporulation protein AF